ncbi:MAG TPA: enoyl-CoA hydratase/isomerase family protein [Solirubrobacteraceae bacterium]
MPERSLTPLRVEPAGDGVAELILDRPDLLNRFDSALHHAFTEALTDLARRDDVRAIVLSSTGSAFSAGGDFDMMRRAHSDPALQRAIVDEARRLFGALLDLPQPIVAAVQGPAIGLGATVVLACDAVVAARTATLADPHVGVGLVAGDGGAIVWSQAVGILRAKRYLLTGDPLDAVTAHDLGLVTDLVDGADDAAPAARQLAARIAQLPPLAVQSTKRVLQGLARERAGGALDLGLALEQETMTTQDHIDRIDAFQSRR